MTTTIASTSASATESTTASTVDFRLRRFFIGLSAVICAVTIVELLLLEHTGDIVQFIPFMLSGLGIVGAVMVLAHPARQMILAFRGLMTLIILGSLFGVYEHLEGNLAFAQELHPNSSIGNLWLEILGGANPLLAPGTLAIASIIAIAATYYHPALEKGS